MRNYLFIGVVFFIMVMVNPLLSQTTTFSIRQDLGNSHSIYRALSVLDGIYYISGPADGVPPNNYNRSHSILIDRFGEVLNDDLLTLDSVEIRGWGTRNFISEQGDFFFTGNIESSGRTAALVKLDGELGYEKYSIYSGDSSAFATLVTFLGVTGTQSSLYAYGGQLSPQSTVNGQQGIIVKYDHDLNVKDTFDIVNAPNDRSSFVVALSQRESGGFLALTQEYKRLGCSPAYQYSLVWVNNDFEFVKRFDSNEVTTASNGMFETELGSVLVQTSAVEHIDFDAGGGNCIPFPVFRNTISKVSGGVAPQLEWEFSFDPPGARRWPEVIQAGIVPTPSPDEFVAAASYKAEQVVLANLVKFDTLGNEIWNRVYGYYDTTDNDVYVYDIKPAPDGGYIMVGQVIVPFTEASDSLGRFPPQQGWIMKVDEDGCLIPGCGDVTITSTRPGEPLPAPELLLYPNPVAHTLYFYLPEIPEATSLSGAVYDATGRSVRELPDRPLVPGMTYSLPVDELPAGTYYLRLSLDDGRMVTKPFLKH